MNEAGRVPDDQPLGLAEVAAADLLLDTLAAGGPGPEGDPAAALLAAWRTELDADLPLDLDPSLAPSPAIAIGVPDGAGRDGADGDAAGRGGPAACRRRVRPIGRLVVGVAAGVAIAVGLAVGAHRAGPGSPLWPITQVVYRQQAEARSAEHAIALAHTATAAGRPGDARRLLADAAAHVAKVRDPELAGRLRAEIDALLRDLDTRVAPPASTPTPALPPPAGTGGATPAPGGAPTGTRGSQAPGKPAPGGPVPGLPVPGGTLPVPPVLPPINPSKVPLPTHLIPLPPLPPILPSIGGLPKPLG